MIAARYKSILVTEHDHERMRKWASIHGYPDTVTAIRGLMDMTDNPPEFLTQQEAEAMHQAISAAQVALANLDEIVMRFRPPSPADRMTGPQTAPGYTTPAQPDNIA